MLRDFPDERQRLDFHCGPACIDAVAKFYGLPYRAPVNLANPVQGTAPETMVAVLRSFGLSVLAGEMSVADLAHLTRSGRPVICCVDLYGGHWVTVTGVSDLGWVHFQCPADGSRSMHAIDWAHHWRDVSSSGHTFLNWGICPRKAGT